METAEHSEKQHYYYIDYIRVFAMLCVIFMHLAAGPVRVSTEHLGKNWHVINGALSLAFTAVPLFFMISGYLLLSGSRTEDIGYLLKHRMPRLLVPLFLWSGAAVLVLTLPAGQSFGDSLRLLATAGNRAVMVHFWFMYTLAGMYLISPFLYRALHGLSLAGHRYLLLLLVLVRVMAALPLLLPENAAQYLPGAFFRELDFFSGNMTAFLLGWLLGETKRRYPGCLLITVGAADWLLITRMTFRLTVRNGAYTADFQNQTGIFEILLAACIFLWCRQQLDRPLGGLSRRIRPLAVLSFPVYLMHNILILLLGWSWRTDFGAPELLGATLLTAALCWLFLKTAATVRPLCYAFTGLSYSEACGSCNWVFTLRRHRKQKEAVRSGKAPD